MSTLSRTPRDRTRTAVGPGGRRSGREAWDVGLPSLVLVVTAVVTCLATAVAQTGHLEVDGTTLVLLASRSLATVATAGALGGLVLCLCRTRSSGPDGPRLAPDPLRSVRSWAAVWLVALVVGLVVEVTDPAGVAAHGSVGPGAADIETRLRWLFAGTLLAALLWVLIGAARTRRDTALALAVGVAGVVVAVQVGHSGSVLGPDLATLSLLTHVLAASVWVGGLLALVVHGPGDGGGAGATLRAYSRIALACYAALTVSGVVGLAARTSLEALLESSDYLALLVAKLTLLLALGVAGAFQRRSHLARRSGGTGGFLVLAVGELVLMAAAMGLAVTLTHTAS